MEAGPTEVKRGWLWKRAVGRSLFGRMNWKMRFIESDVDGLRYYSAEPFTVAQACVRWEDVVHVLDDLPADIRLEPDPAAIYFGVRFKGSEKGEHVLLFRTDDAEEQVAWVKHFTRMTELLSLLDDDGDEPEDLRSGALEQISRRLRSLVSLQKQRFLHGEFDLDLAYVLPNVLAMGFPSEGRETYFRNPMSHVVKFFEQFHKRRFLVLNLCSERAYPATRFGGNFERFPFDDHNPPPLALLYPLCERMLQHLSGGRAACTSPQVLLDARYGLQGTDEPVVAVHCKAGKGRTGLVVCAYLLYAGICDSPDTAMQVFASRRTHDGKGIQIPSQRRYLEYFHASVHLHGGQIPTNVVLLREMTIGALPPMDVDTADFFVRVERRRADHQHVPLGRQECVVHGPIEVLADGPAVPLRSKQPGRVAIGCEVGGDDFRLSLVYTVGTRTVTLFSCWLHTGFLPPSGAVTLTKAQMDDAVKNRKVPKDFNVTVRYTMVRAGPTQSLATTTIPVLDH